MLPGIDTTLMRNAACLRRLACLVSITFGTFACGGPPEPHDTTTAPSQSALNQRAIESLRRQGFDVEEETDLIRLKFTSDKYDLTPLADLTAPLAIDLDSQTVPDETLATIAGNPHVVELNLAGCVLTDEGIALLAKLRNLRLLNMDSSRGITDWGLMHVGELTHLESLNLNETPLSDDGLKHLSRLTDLKTLCARHTQITDSGLIHLKRCTRLKDFFYHETMVTPDEAADLLAGRGKYALELRSIKVGQGENDAVNALVYSPDGKSLACATRNWDLKGHLRMLDVDSLQVRFTTPNNAIFEPHLAFMPDSKSYWTTGSGRALENCDTQSGNTLATHSFDDVKVWFIGDLHVVANGNRLVARVIDHIATTMIPPQQHWTLHKQSASPMSLDIEPDGRWCVVGNDDGHVGLWDLVEGKRHAQWDDHKWDIAAVAISRAGELVASADEIERVIVRDRRTGKILWQRGLDCPKYLLFSPDGKLLVYGDSYPTTITIVDARTGVPVRNYKGHAGYIRSAAATPNGKVIVTGGDDGQVKFWEMPQP